MRLVAALFCTAALTTAVISTASPADAAPSRAAQANLFKQPPAREYSRLLLQARQTGSYQADVIVPVLRSQSPAARAANRAVLAWSRRDLRQFVHRARTEKRTAGREYFLETGPGPVLITRRLVSFTMGRYYSFGGAHPMTESTSFNYGTVNGRGRALRLRDFFRGNAYRKHVNDLVMKKLRANPDAGFAAIEEDQPPMISSLTTEQLNGFSVQPNGLYFHFDPSEMAAYAVGATGVTLSPQELGPTFRREWLRR